MAENKTKKTVASVKEFIASQENEQRRKDSLTLIAMMKSITGKAPKMWGTTLIGFGDHHYKYESGREGDIFQVGFSPRKTSLVLYSLNLAKQQSLLDKLGKYKTGKGCLYINKLDDVDQKTLKALIEKSFKDLAT